MCERLCTHQKSPRWISQSVRSCQKTARGRQKVGKVFKKVFLQWILASDNVHKKYDSLSIRGITSFRVLPWDIAKVVFLITVHSDSFHIRTVFHQVSKYFLFMKFYRDCKCILFDCDCYAMGQSVPRNRKGLIYHGVLAIFPDRILLKK